MPIDTSLLERVFTKIDQEELVSLVMALTDIDSPTGREREISDYVLAWFEKNGFHTIKQVVETERYNAIGILKGTGNGPSLTINGHLDIVYWAKRNVPKSYVKDGVVYGHEIENMRAGLASFMMAGKALKEAGVKLSGDLALATVIGEISTTGAGQFQGPQDRGEGHGTRHLLTHGIQTDYAIVADGSDFAIVRAQCGDAWFRIATTGKYLYTPYTKRPDKAEESQNPIIKMTRVIDTIEKWAREYEIASVYAFPRGRVEPKVSINKIQAGMPSVTQGGWREPFDPAMSPGSCEIYVDVRTPPGLAPLEVKHRLEKLLGGLPFECEIEMIRSQMGYEGTGPRVEYLSSAIGKAYEQVTGKPTPIAAPGESSMWTDTNLYWEAGIPAVKWGPSDHVKYFGRTRVDVEALVRAARVFSLIALEVCQGIA